MGASFRFPGGINLQSLNCLDTCPPPTLEGESQALPTSPQLLLGAGTEPDSDPT